jgi:curved DNA-binding protein CbpA
MAPPKRKFDPNFDPYKALGIDIASSDKDIDKAFKKLALKWHPDKNPDNLKEAQQRFVEVYQAYEFLKDKTKKAEFDEVMNAKKKRAVYDNKRKETSSAKRQQFLDKLLKKEKAFENGCTPGSSKSKGSDSVSGLKDDEEAFLKRLRKEGAQLLKRMHDEQLASEQQARQKDIERHEQELQRQYKEQVEAARAKKHPDTHLYDMSIDEFKAMEDEILGI